MTAPTPPAAPATDRWHDRMPVVVADVDTGIDDALALTYLAHLHKHGVIQLRVTTSAGNCGASQAAANSAEVLAACGVDIPVIAGAAVPRVVPLTTTPETHGPSGLGYHRTTHDPSDYQPDVAAAVASWEGADLLLVVGPATNLAWAVDHAPQVVAGMRVCFMAGAFAYPGNTTPTAEWNAWVDPHALKHALDELVPLDGTALTGQGTLPVICPLNVTEQVLLTPERLRDMRLSEVLGSDSVSGTVLDDALRFYFEFHQEVGVGYVAQIHDLAAAMVLLERNGVIPAGTVGTTTVAATVDVETGSELMRGTTVADYVGGTLQGETRSGEGSTVGEDARRRDALGVADKEEHVGPYWKRPANAEVLTGLNAEKVFKEFERVLCEVLR